MRLLDLLAPGELVTFQTFDDDRQRAEARKAAAKAAGEKPRDPLAKWMHGTLAQHRARLADLNARGAGVFWMVNAGDGKGRKASNVRRIRALFVDLDGSPLEPVQRAPLQPHCIVQSSPGKWHAYWRIADCPTNKFSDMQKALATRFSGDAKVCDLPRVLRLPGFMHRKGEPFSVALVALCDKPPYTLAELVQALDLRAPEASKPAATVTPIRARKLPQEIYEGERNNTLLSRAAGFVRQGFSLQEITKRLHKINANECKPPLPDAEVDGIAAQAFAYGSEGFSILTDELLDSRELNALPLPARWIVLRAFRRHNGHNNGNIALTHADCRDIPGCADEKPFIAYRSQAVASGILRLAQPGRMTRNGKTPHLYAIAGKYLPSHTGQITPLAHTGRFTPSYIDKLL